MTTLRDYLITRLPEVTINGDRLTAFFEEADVTDYMTQIEQLIEQLVTKWQQEPPIDSVAEPSGVEPSAPATSDQLEILNPAASTPAETGSDEKPAPVFSFLAADKEVDVSLPPDQSVGNPTMVGSIYEITPPRSATDANTLQPTADAVRFFPTNQAETPASKPIRAISIPNATVGKPYTFTFDFSALGLPELTNHALSMNAATGLTYDQATQTLSGTPIESGEFSSDLSYRPKTDESNRPALTRQIQLLINPDPRSLWKDLPSDASDRYYKPDSATDILSVGDVRLIAASVRGRSHAHEGKFRDDDFNLTHLTETGWYLLSVADGAGSAKYSRKGAQLACQMVKEHLQKQIDPQSWTNLDAIIDQYATDSQESIIGAVHRQLYDVLGKAIFAAYKAIESEAQTTAAEPKDYATTLITVLTKPVAGGWFVGAFWVGDGGVGIYYTDREPTLLGTPDGGEYAGQTRFLTMSETIANNFFGRFRFALVSDFTAIVLMTDGITDPKFQTDGNLGRKESWDELWLDLNQGVSFTDEDRAAAQLQEWLTFWSPGNHDDRTIALLYTHAGNAKN